MPEVISAARIAYAFQIDPLTVLDATPDEWLIRHAAAVVIHDDQERAERRSRRS